jgi:hypothetical protein
LAFGVGVEGGEQRGGDWRFNLHFWNSTPMGIVGVCVF